jgi:hypothetical protein
MTLTAQCDLIPFLAARDISWFTSSRRFDSDRTSARTSSRTISTRMEEVTW